MPDPGYAMKSAWFAKMSGAHVLLVQEGHIPFTTGIFHTASSCWDVQIIIQTNDFGLLLRNENDF
jgi:hypothetical protein